MLQNRSLGLLLSLSLLTSPAFASVLDERLILAAEEGNFPAIVRLVESGADINFVDSLGFTPLMHAAYIGNAQIVRYLVHKRADLHKRANISNDSAIEMARDHNFPEIVEILAAAEAGDFPTDSDVLQTEVTDVQPQAQQFVSKSVKISPLPFYNNQTSRDPVFVKKLLDNWNGEINAFNKAVQQGLTIEDAVNRIQVIQAQGTLLGTVYPPVTTKVKNIIALFRGSISSRDFLYFGTNSELSFYVPAQRVDVSSIPGYTVVTFSMTNYGSVTHKPNFYINHTLIISTTGQQIKALTLPDLFADRSLYEVVRKNGGTDAYQYPSLLLPEAEADFQLVFPGEISRDQIRKIVYTGLSGEPMVEIPFWENIQ